MDDKTGKHTKGNKRRIKRSWQQTRENWWLAANTVGINYPNKLGDKFPVSVAEKEVTWQSAAKCLQYYNLWIRGRRQQRDLKVFFSYSKKIDNLESAVSYFHLKS